MVKMEPRVQTGDIAIIEDPPTGVARQAEGLVIDVRVDGFVTVRVGETDFTIWQYDLSLKRRP